MGCDDDDTARRGDGPQQVQHRLDLDVVEVCRRLVSEEHRGVERQGSGNGNALLLTARQLRRSMVQPVLQTELPQSFGGSSSPVAPGISVVPERHRHVVLSGQAGQEVERLEDHADRSSPIFGKCRAPKGGDLDVVQLDRAGGRRQERGERRQQGRLATSTGTEQEDELAIICLEGQVPHGCDFVSAGDVPQRHVSNLERRHADLPKAIAGSTPAARR